MQNIDEAPDPISTVAPPTRSMGWHAGRDLPPAIVFLGIFYLLRKVIGVPGLMQLGFVVVAVLLMWPLNDGRLYRYLGVNLPVNKILLPKAKGRIWQFDSSRLAWYRRHVIPLTPHGIPQLRGDMLGAIYDKRNGIYSLVVGARGWNTAALSLEGQYRNHQALASVLKEISGIPDGYSLGISFPHLRLPLNTPSLATMQQELNHPDVNLWWERIITGSATPDEGLNEDELMDKRLAEYQIGLLAASEANANDLVAVMVVSLYPDQKLAEQFSQANDEAKKRAKKGALTQRQVHDLTISRLARAVEAKLAALKVDDPHCLSYEEVTDFLRGWDLKFRDQYFGSNLVVPPGSERQHPQHHILLQRDRETEQLQVVMDGSYWAVFVLTQQDLYLAPNYYRILRTLDARYFAFTLVGTTLRTDTELRAMEFGGKLLTDFREGIRGSEQVGRKAQARDERRESRADQHQKSGYQLPFNIVIAVGDTESAHLETIARRVEDYLEGERTGPKRVNDGSVVIDYLVSALFGANLL